MGMLFPFHTRTFGDRVHWPDHICHHTFSVLADKIFYLHNFFFSRIDANAQTNKLIDDSFLGCRCVPFLLLLLCTGIACGSTYCIVAKRFSSVLMMNLDIFRTDTN